MLHGALRLPSPAGGGCAAACTATRPGGQTCATKRGDFLRARRRRVAEAQSSDDEQHFRNKEGARLVADRAQIAPTVLGGEGAFPLSPHGIARSGAVSCLSVRP